MNRKRGRITVQSQPTGVEKGMMKGMGVIHAVMGLVFVVASVTMIIPNAGLFGLPFLLGGAFFAVNGIRLVVSKNDVAHRVAYDVEQDMAESVVGIFEDAPLSVEEDAPIIAGTTESRLLELKSLYDRDLITYDEYEEKRKEILRDL